MLRCVKGRMCIVYGIPKKIKIPVELSVAHLLLLHSELLPVTLLLGSQGSNFTLVLFEPEKQSNFQDLVKVKEVSANLCPTQMW